MSENDIVEPEIEDSSEQPLLMRTPFDPTLINIETKTPSLNTLIERIGYEEIMLNTSSYFQRADNLWKEEVQSRLIESILVGFPLPAFYFDGTNPKRWLVVDGLQRLSSIRNFVVKTDKPLRLKGLEFLTQLEGLTYQELHRDLQRLIKETTVVTHVITANTPNNVKFNIFKRINTGGIPLNSQEIRHALFQGIPATFVAELAGEASFQEATDYTFREERRMLDREFVNRFLCFYSLDMATYESDLDTFMSKALAELLKSTEDERKKIKQHFIASMQLSFEIWGKNTFRKIYKGIDKRKPINKAIFDAVAVQFALLSEVEKNILKQKKDIFKEKFSNLLIEDKDFFWAVSSATDNKKRVEYRQNTIKKLIHHVINS